MNYFLDTNIIVHIYTGEVSKFKKNVIDIIGNSRNNFFASAISLNEIVQLVRKKRIKEINYEVYDTPEKILTAILTKTKGIITFLPYEPKYAKIVAKLQYVPKHNDPNDLSIMAHSIGKRMAVITTDHKFPDYENQGVKTILNPL